MERCSAPESFQAIYSPYFSYMEPILPASEELLADFSVSIVMLNMARQYYGLFTRPSFIDIKAIIIHCATTFRLLYLFISP